MAVETAAGASAATAKPMSPWASASLISNEGTAERSSRAPPSSSGTPTIVNPSSLAWLSSACGAAQSASACSAAGRIRCWAKSLTDSRSICCSSLGVRSNRSLRRARGWRAGFDSFWAAAKVRPARAAVRTEVLVAPWSRRSVGSRRPKRSTRPDDARRLSARRLTAIPRSARFSSRPIAAEGTTRCCYMS